MKTEQRLKVTGIGFSIKPEAVIVVRNHELAEAVGEDVERKYGDEALNVIFEMKRKWFTSDTADVAAGVEVRKRETNAQDSDVRPTMARGGGGQDQKRSG